jgi:hypothetical protein
MLFIVYESPHISQSIKGKGKGRFYGAYTALQPDG